MARRCAKYLEESGEDAAGEQSRSTVGGQLGNAMWVVDLCRAFVLLKDLLDRKSDSNPRDQFGGALKWGGAKARVLRSEGLGLRPS